MKRSTTTIKSWSKLHDGFIYYFIVYGNRQVELSYDTPREYGIIMAMMNADEFMEGAIDHLVRQYLGDEQLTQIRSFLEKKKAKI